MRLRHKLNEIVNQSFTPYIEAVLKQRIKNETYNI